jgi:SAM-dependent methyltransferase
MNNQSSRHRIVSTRDVVAANLRYMKGRVLDAGGGPAAKYRDLISAVAGEYVCLDAKAGGHVDVVGDVLAMPFESDSFDTVVCNQVIEHVSDPDRLISESFRVVKVGGYALFTAPFMQPVHADPDDFRRYTAVGLAHALRQHGFEVVHAGGYGGFWVVVLSCITFSWFNPYHPHNRIARRIARWTGMFFHWLDGGRIPGRIYSDCYALAIKKVTLP